MPKTWRPSAGAALKLARRVVPAPLVVRLEPRLRWLYGYLLRSWTFVVRPLSLVPGRIGPPRRAERDPQRFAQLDGVDIIAVAPACTLTHELPPSGVDLNIEFARQQRIELPGTYVVTIANGRVCGADAAVIGPRDTVLTDVANRFIEHRAGNPIFRRVLLPSVSRLPGTAVVPTAAFAGFYYHWMTEILPRFLILGDELGRADQVISPAGKPFQAESLQRLGVARERVVEPDARAHYQADRLVVPSLAGTMNHVRPESIRFVRELFGIPCVDRPLAHGRRLYVSRQHDFRRRITNEHEVRDLLSELGFEAVEPGTMTVAAQAQLFADAEIVVGPHGGGLTNIMFCAPGTAVLEIFPPGSLPLTYWTLASSARLSYALIVGRAAQRRDPNSSTPTQWRDIDVDCEELAQQIKALTERLP